MKIETRMIRYDQEVEMHNPVGVEISEPLGMSLLRAEISL